MTDLSALIERLERARGPGYALDVDICLALNYAGPHAPANFCDLRASEDEAGWLDYECDDGHPIRGCTDAAPDLTASLDAAIALCERVLPGEGWSVAIGRIERVPVARIWTGETDDGIARKGATPAIALCLATLRALQTKEDAGAPTPEQSNGR